MNFVAESKIQEFEMKMIQIITWWNLLENKTIGKMPAMMVLEIIKVNQL